MNSIALIDTAFSPAANGDHDALRRAIVRHLVDQVFSSWPIEKLSAIDHAFSGPCFAGQTFSWSVEAVLPDNYLHGGRYWDRIYSAVFREEWADGRAA